MKRLCLTSLLILVLLGFAGCSSTPPDKVVADYLDTIRQGDLKTAAEFLQSSETDMFAVPDMDENERIAKAILAKVTYTIGEQKVQGSNATVDVEIVAPDLLRITSQLMGEMLSLAFSMAFSGNTSQEQMNTMFLQTFENSINDPEAPMVASSVQIKLIRRGNSWAIVPDEVLGDALTGNMLKAFAEMTGK